MLVASDQITDKDWPALSRAKGDAFMIVGATLYGISMSTHYFLIVTATDYIFVTTLKRMQRKSSSLENLPFMRSLVNSACGVPSSTEFKLLL